MISEAGTSMVTGGVASFPGYLFSSQGRTGQPSSARTPRERRPPALHFDGLPHGQLHTLNPKCQIPNAKPQMPNPKLQTLNHSWLTVFPADCLTD